MYFWFHLIAIVEGLQWASTVFPPYIGSIQISFYKQTNKQTQISNSVVHVSTAF